MSFASVGRSLYFLDSGTDLVTHSSHAMMFPFVDGSSVVGKNLSLHLLHALYMQNKSSSLQTLARTASLGDDVTITPRWCSLFVSWPEISCTLQLRFSIRDSSLTNPKRLEFEELNHGKAGPWIFRQKSYWPLCSLELYSVRSVPFLKFLLISHLSHHLDKENCLQECT